MLRSQGVNNKKVFSCVALYVHGSIGTINTISIVVTPRRQILCVCQTRSLYRSMCGIQVLDSSTLASEATVFSFYNQTTVFCFCNALIVMIKICISVYTTDLL